MQNPQRAIPPAGNGVLTEKDFTDGELGLVKRKKILEQQAFPASDEELASIEREAKANGTWLKAPNGNPSNLNERQWVQVRTQSFKKWFGDWEKGALLSSLSDVTKSAGKAETPFADVKDKRLLSILQADSSKVVDENGEPLVVYHGSRTGGHFYEFANNSFFSDDFDAADMFKREADFDLYVNGKVVGTVGDEDAEFLANELSDGDYTAKDIAGWGEIAREDISSDYVIDEVRRLSDYEVSEDEIETVRLVPTRGVFDVFLNIRNPLVVDYGGKVWMDNSFLPEDKIKEARKKKEHDGVVVKNIVEGGFTGEYRGGGEPRPSTDYIPFSPEQIKSATDNVGTFGAGNPDIRFSVGSALEPTAETNKNRFEKINKLLARISKTAGIKIIRENSEQIRKSAEKEEAGRYKIENDRFNAELEAFKAGTHKGVLHLGVPGAILRASGLNATEITIEPKVLKEHLGKHDIAIDEIQNLPESLNNPLMVYEWGTKARSLIVITDLTLKDGRKITAAVKLERGGKRVEINEIASIHGKAAERFLEDMTTAKHGGLKDALRYVSDKKKALAWLGLVPPMGTATQSAQEPDLHGIIENFENPSIENNLRSLSSNGVIYGYFDPVRRELHLNEDFADFDTPIHEWTHVWWDIVAKKDARITQIGLNSECKMQDVFFLPLAFMRYRLQNERNEGYLRHLYKNMSSHQWSSYFLTVFPVQTKRFSTKIPPIL